MTDDELKENDTARAELTATRVLEELARIAFSDIRAFFTEAGALKPLHELEPAAAAALASVDVTERVGDDGQVVRTIRFTLWDKPRALETLARHFGLLIDRVEVSDAGTLMETIAALKAEREAVH